MLELKIVEIDDSSGFYQVGLPKFPVELVFCKYVESNKLFNETWLQYICAYSVPFKDEADKFWYL